MAGWGGWLQQLLFDLWATAHRCALWPSSIIEFNLLQPCIYHGPAIRQSVQSEKSFLMDFEELSLAEIQLEIYTLRYMLGYWFN